MADLIQGYIIVGLIAFVALTYLFRSYKEFKEVTSHWQNSFDIQFSTQEFYKLVQDGIERRKAPDVTFARHFYARYHSLSIQQEYLSVKFNNHRYLICAAPYGTCFFVSCWAGTTIGVFEDLLTRLPVIGLYISYLYNKRTFYEIDEESMFKNCVTTTVQEAIESITIDKGIRSIGQVNLAPTRIFRRKVSA